MLLLIFVPIDTGADSDEQRQEQIEEPFEMNSKGTIVGYDSSKDKNFPDVIIPQAIDGQQVVSIGERVFNHIGMESVKLPEGIKIIGAFAFNGNHLSTLDLPDTVTTIGDYAFNGNHLSTLDLPGGLVHIGDSAFSYNRITQIKLPTTLRTIGTTAFAINDLTTVRLNEGLESIGNNAFVSNHILNIKLPASVTTVGKDVLAENSVWITVNEVSDFNYEDKTVTVNWHKFLEDHGVLGDGFTIKASTVSDDVVPPVSVGLGTDDVTVTLRNYDPIEYNKERTLFDNFDVVSTNGKVTIDHIMPIRFRNDVILIDIGKLQDTMSIRQGDALDFKNNVHAFDMHDGIVSYTITANGKPITTTADLPTGKYTVTFTATTDTADSVDDTGKASASRSITLTVEPSVPVLYLHEEYILGYPDGMVRAAQNITRGEVVTVIARLLPDVKYADLNYYTDVVPSNFYYDSINKLISLDILKKSYGITFSAGTPITRAEFIALVVKMDTLGVSIAPVDDMSHWADAYIRYAYDEGYILEYAGFEPDGLIPRAQAITVLNRVTQRQPDIAKIDALKSAYPDLSTDYWAYYDIMEATVVHDYMEKDDVEEWTKIFE